MIIFNILSYLPFNIYTRQDLKRKWVYENNDIEVFLSHKELYNWNKELSLFCVCLYWITIILHHSRGHLKIYCSQRHVGVYV